MTTLVAPGPSAPASPAERRLPRLRELGPNWYAAVMGTAIVATGGTALPDGQSWLPPVCAVVWALSALMLVVLVAARAGHWLFHRDRAAAHLMDPAVAPFYGCLAMALLAVGGAGAAAGSRLIGTQAALVLDGVLWTAGTVAGLATAVVVPYLMVARHDLPPGTAAPAWLLPVVPPMVSAATGPALAAHLPAGQDRQAMVWACYALFGISALATVVVLPLVVGRLVHHGPLPLALTPTLLFVLGPLGQSVTAAGRIADAAGALPAPLARAAVPFAVLYGVPVMGFALLWLALSAGLLVRAARRGMGFAMTWWAFTFPVGTCVTGAAVLASHTGLRAAGILADLLYVLLVAGWLAAAFRTARGLIGGALLAPAPRAPAVPR